MTALLAGASLFLVSSAALADDSPTPPPSSDAHPAGASTSADDATLRAEPAEDAPSSSDALPPETPPPPMAPRIDVPLAPAPAAVAFTPMLGGQRTLTLDRSEPPLDWMAPGGITSLSLGGVLALSGVVVFATKADEQQCGRSGCVDRPDYVADNLGASLLGAGIGFAIVGGATLAAGLTVTPGPGERRVNQPMMVAGLGFTALSAAGVGLTIAQATTYEPGTTTFTTAWAPLVGSIAAAGLGIPLLAVGADIETPAEREADRLEGLAPRSNGPRSIGLVVAGSVLTSIGGLAGLGGTILTLVDTAAGGPSFVTLLLGLPLIGGGGVFAGIGVPLLCAGAKRGTRADTAPRASMPEVQVGPTGFSSTWRF